MQTSTAPIPVPVKTQSCPQCRAEIPVLKEYVTWCDQCGWNVQPNTAKRPASRIEILYDALGEKYGRKLFEELSNRESLQAIGSTPKLIAFGLAGLVQFLTLLVLAAGLALVILGWPYIFVVLPGVVLLGLAWLLRPRFPEKAKEILDRGKYPALYELADGVAEKLGTKVDAIEVNEHYTASFSRTGIGQERTLRIGLPLWLVLEDQEKVALLAHELAHDVNGDAGRSLFVGTAIDSLIKWYRVTRPVQIFDPEQGLVAFLMVPVNLLGLLASGVAWAGVYLISTLLYADSQRAEYLADRIACKTAGAEAIVGVLKKIYYADLFYLTVQNCVNNSANIPDLFSAFANRVANMPQRELDRLERLEAITKNRLSLTHPPTPFRLAMIKAGEPGKPAVDFDPGLFERASCELEPFKKKVQQKLVDQFTRALYY